MNARGMSKNLTSSSVLVEGAGQGNSKAQSSPGSFFGCVGKFEAETLGDAGQTKWLTWNYDAAPVNY